MKWTDQSPPADLPLFQDQSTGKHARRTLTTGDQSAAASIVTIDAAVHQTVLAHLRTSNKELGGLLLGRAWGNPENPVEAAWVEVLASIPATDSSGTGYSLRMGAGVWSAANAGLDDLNAAASAQTKGENAARIIGWYHSHPGLGAFFSATDRTTQAAFFTNAYSIGWVIDPSDDTHACFVGPDSRTVAQCVLV
ncbi:MAG: Mov34/MPN/PAD-1 family protein [Burkholderiaceae bacterium]